MIASSPTPLSPPPIHSTQHQNPRIHRVRGLSFLHRRPRGTTPSPPVSPPDQPALERATSYPLAVSNSASSAASPLSNPGAASTGPDSNKKATLAPENSSMARLRRAFSSQNGISPQQQTQTPNANSSSSAAAANNGPKTAPQQTTSQQATVAESAAGPSNAVLPSSSSHDIAVTTPGEMGGRDGLAPDQMPTIKFIPHQDPRASKPSLAFASTSRTLPHEDCVIRVGRYSERDGIQNPPSGVASAAPVGFKSKVVSRKHCEFWCSRGQWYIKDVKSSSGTFLNHIRLSQPNTESKPFPINDGDVVQLGIDFKGGEEAIFRCVKIRIECNRNWQKKLNDFNMNTHKQLRELNKATAEKNGKNATECAICLMSIAPCQSLFMAPCSHIWHFKCIQPMLNDHKTYPQFVCPNCRAVTDLEADIEDTGEWNPEQDSASDDSEPAAEEAPTRSSLEARADGAAADRSSPPSASELPVMNGEGDASELVAAVETLELGDTSIDAALHSTTQPVEVPGSSARHLNTPSRNGGQNGSLRSGTPGAEAELVGSEGPLTPRNDAGPFVFDGSAGRASGRRVQQLTNGDASGDASSRTTTPSQSTA